MLNTLCVVDASNESFSSYMTAEEIIKCASETAALKQLSGSLMVTQAVASAEIPYRDSEIDGAEDAQQNACERSGSVCSAESDESKAAECSTSDSVATLPSQKTVAVSALASGVYITKPSALTDSLASSMQERREVADSAAQKCRRDTRRQQLQKLFPILHDLGQRPQHS